MVVQAIKKTLSKIIGSRNDRLLKQYTRRVSTFNELEPEMRALSDSALKAKTAEFRRLVSEGQTVADLLPQIMAAAREAMDRSVGIRNIFNPEHEFDVAQLPPAAQELYRQTAEKINLLEPADVLGGEPAPPWLKVDVPLELYAAVRELFPRSRPPFRARPFDVQLIGGMVLGEGRIAEMKTGEGKTIVAPLACYVACIADLQCHVVTVNDYLVQRDRDWVFPFYYALGLQVGAIHPYHMQPPPLKAQAYQCDVLYGTNAEFGFDYLRDNMKLTADEQVQKRREFCIVDEIDSILIDEARTPLIISGPAHEDAPRYDMADGIARQLAQQQRDFDAKNRTVEQAEMRVKGLEGDIRNARDKSKVSAMRDQMQQLADQLPQLEADRDQHVQYYEVELEKKAAHLTHEGVAEAQKQAGVGSFYVGNNMDFPHLLENALRAHVVYQRDKDYVVKDGEVVIVDEFTGRLMIGRQWSDGLHQAIEAKERVKIKQETQTMATVTIQNFFKLYKRLGGMTGTAVTEATEFHEIYKLEVVCIPTNVPVIRSDRNDLIFLAAKDKWNAIVDEIKRIHDVGRPVLVGTTSVEKSETLSRMLTKKHGIKHEVLNAKQHEREAHMVEHAGELGAVMIATNMAGRGTDIKLRPIERATLVRHWQVRDLLPRQSSADMTDEQLLNLTYRHQAQSTLGIKAKEADALSDEELKLRLFRHWVEEDAWVAPEKAAAMSLEQCLVALDKLPDYDRHRMKIWDNAESMGGLHIVGTERHEARRIDNQLRGRSGRQGDNGASRFFISLEDDLMSLFAGKTTMTALSKLGMKEGDAIEHKWVTNSVERAQKKVEERNYEIRKNLLEYDEVMEHQRNTFYGMRQDVLEDRYINEMIFGYISQSVEEAVATYLDKQYVQTQVAEWCRQTLDVSVEPSKLHLGDPEQLQIHIRDAASHEAGLIINVTLGEYMSNDIAPEDWDLRGLSSWAMSRFSVDIKANRLREMNIDDVSQQLTEAARQQINKKDLSGLHKFLVPAYDEKDLAAWAKTKFDIDVDIKPQTEQDTEIDPVIDQILNQAHEAYARRKITYPVEFILDLVMQGAQQDANWAVEQLLKWVNQRYELGWTTDDVNAKTGPDLYKILVAESEAWIAGGKLETQIDEQIKHCNNDPKLLAPWMEQRFGVELTAAQLEEPENCRSLLVDKGREALHLELTQLERFVLLQILDQAWKDHLYGMDQLKDSINLRGYAEKDPRIEYKREGANHFQEMQSRVRDRVTELIFRARLTPNVQIRSAYGEQQDTHHDDAGSTVDAAARQRRSAAASAAAQGTADQRADMEAAERAGGDDATAGMPRKQRRAAEARQRKSTRSASGKQRKRKSR
jgi:preprotein translocase subunit SecA